MKHHGAFKLSLAGLFAWLVLPATASALALSLEEALARAPEANFQILLSEQGLAAQEQNVRLSRSALFPQINLEAAQSRSMSPNVSPVTRSIPGIPKRFFVDRFDAVLRTRLSLYNSRSIDDWRISKLSLQATEWQLENTVQQILQQIALAYFSHWRNGRRLEVIDATLERDRVLLQIAQDQQSAGVATSLDVTRAEVRLASNELARLQQENLVLESELNLKRILNLPLGEPLTLEEIPITVGERPFTFSEARFTTVLKNRPDYRQLETEREREELSVNAAWREYLPSLTLSGDWGYAAETWSDSKEEQWSIQLGVSMPVFEGFRIDSQKRLARANLRSREIELEQLTATIEADYRLILQQLQSRLRQVEVAERARDLNIREYELARIRFEEGVADNSDVVDAQAALADAEDALVEAEFELLSAQVNLARTEGDVRQLLRQP